MVGGMIASSTEARGEEPYEENAAWRNDDESAWSLRLAALLKEFRSISQSEFVRLST